MDITGLKLSWEVWKSSRDVAIWPSLIGGFDDLLAHAAQLRADAEQIRKAVGALDGQATLTAVFAHVIANDAGKNALAQLQADKEKAEKACAEMRHLAERVWYASVNISLARYSVPVQHLRDLCDYAASDTCGQGYVSDEEHQDTKAKLAKELARIVAERDARISKEELRPTLEWLKAIDSYLRGAAKARGGQGVIMYPIQKGPSVPWEVMAPHESRCQANHSQSIARIAERGGFSPAEAWCIVQNLGWHQMEETIGWKKAGELWVEYAERINLHYAELAQLRSDLKSAQEWISATVANCSVFSAPPTFKSL